MRAPCFISSTIGRKQIIGLTGLGLCGFVLTHMLGNMLIFVSPQAYNEYSHKLITNPFIEIAEIGLVVLFFVHLAMALRLQLKNWGARPEGYAVSGRGDKKTDCVSKTMWAQGLLILVFVILHLNTFKYGAHYVANYGNGEIRDLHRLVVEVFQNAGYLLWYLIALVVLGLHLAHGVGSLFQTFGIHHPRYTKLITGLSHFYATLVAGGFISQPIYVYFIYKG